MSEDKQKWNLTLYVGGESPQSVKAIRNMRVLMDRFLGPKQPCLNVENVMDNPKLVRSENILALPTLVRESPLPTVRIVGDMADIDKVWAVLNDE